MLMQNFGITTKIIMLFLKKTYDPGFHLSTELLRGIQNHFERLYKVGIVKAILVDTTWKMLNYKLNSNGDRAFFFFFCSSSSSKSE